MNSKELDVLKKILIEADDEVMKTPPKTFEDDPMRFILNKYQSLKDNLVELLGENFEEYLTAIYIISPKPTMFKIVLHNNQYFFMTYMGETYQITIAGKNYLLFNAGEKQRAMLALSRLLKWGSPLKTKGGEGAEATASTEETPSEEAPAETSSEEGGGGGEETETLEESISVLKKLIESDYMINEGKEEASKFEQVSVDLWNASVDQNENAPRGYKKYEKLYQSINNIVDDEQTSQKLAKYSQRRDEVTKYWHDAHGSKSVDEPKTDIKSENSKYRISVKKGNSQLMSPEKKEAIATIKAAASASGLSKRAENKAIEIVNKFAGRTKTSELNTSELSKAKKSSLDNVNKKARAVYDAAYEAHKEFIEYMNKLMESDADFRREFAFEAASGNAKFGNGSDARANYILSISKDGTYAELHQMKTSNSPIVKTIADKMKLNVTMKSNSYESKETGEWGYGFYSSARLALDDLLKKTGTTKEAYERYEKEKSKGLITEEKAELYENIFSRAFNWIKDKVLKIWNFIQEKIKEAIKMIKSGFNGLLKAMEIEPDVPEEVYTQEIDLS